LQMKADLLIEGGKVWIRDALYEVSIAVEDGRIAAIGAPSSMPRAERVYDASGKMVLPGVVDSHVHSREPGMTDREDFLTITRAAAAGGVTTIFDMPNTIPPTSTVSAFREKRALAESKAIVDFALFAGAGTDNIDQLPALAEAGAIGFKLFLTMLAPDRVQEMWGMFVKNDGSFLDVLSQVKKTGLALAVHSENGSMIDHLTAKLKAEGRQDWDAFEESRPSISEIEAVNKVILLGQYTGARVHICHVGSYESAEIIREAKLKGVKVTAELTPLYLLLSKDDVPRLGPYGLIFPPLRSRSNMEALYGYYNDGVIDIMNSDHAPYSRSELDVGWTDMWKTPPDGSAIEVMLSLMLNEAYAGRTTLERVINSLTELPARIFGVYPQKGTIMVGSDADIVVVDREREWTIVGKQLHTKQQVTQFEGVTVHGMPVATFVRGQQVMDGREIIAQPGIGRFVPGAAFSA